MGATKEDRRVGENPDDAIRIEAGTDVEQKREMGQRQKEESTGGQDTMKERCKNKHQLTWDML